MKDQDVSRVADHPWVKYVRGENADYPMLALNRDYATMKRHVTAFRADKTTPQTRLADNELNNDPAIGTVDALMQLMMGCIPRPDGGSDGGLISARLRYFDPTARRAGLPPDVGALVSRLSDDSTTVTFVNLSISEPRTFIVQGGAYAEHEIESVTMDGKQTDVGSTFFTVTLGPGCGGAMTIRMKRYAAEPTEKMPWARGKP
jgi:hypothetical protein